MKELRTDFPSWNTPRGFDINYSGAERPGNVTRQEHTRIERLHIIAEKRVFGIFAGRGIACYRGASQVTKSLSALQEGLTLQRTQELIRQALVDANQVIDNQAPVEHNDTGVSASIVHIWVGQNKERKAIIGNVGNNRVYLLRNGELRQITLDDNQRLGQLKVEPRIHTIDLLPADRLLVCSRGILNLTDREIQETLNTKQIGPVAKTAVNMLSDASIRKSGKHNYDIALIIVGEDPPIIPHPNIRDVLVDKVSSLKKRITRTGDSRRQWLIGPHSEQRGYLLVAAGLLGIGALLLAIELYIREEQRQVPFQEKPTLPIGSTVVPKPSETLPAAILPIIIIPSTPTPLPSLTPSKKLAAEPTVTLVPLPTVTLAPLKPRS